MLFAESGDISWYSKHDSNDGLVVVPEVQAEEVLRCVDLTVSNFKTLSTI